jgi:hypothetical protein
MGLCGTSCVLRGDPGGWWGGGRVARVSVAMLRVGLGTNEDAVSGVVDVPNRPTPSLSSQCPNKVV